MKRIINDYSAYICSHATIEVKSQVAEVDEELQARKARHEAAYARRICAEILAEFDGAPVPMPAPKPMVETRAIIIGNAAIERRVCRVCGQELSIYEFYKHPSSTGGRMHTCRRCTYQYQKQRKQERKKCQK